MFTTLKQQLEKAKIEEVKESNYVIVQDPPEIPLTRSSPKKKKSVILSTFIGFMLGIVISFLKEFIYQSKKYNEIKISEISKHFSDLYSPLFSKNKKIN